MRRIAAICVLGCALLLGCGDGGGGGGVDVVATTTQVADLARNVARGRAEVHSILRPNADPHDYEPRPSDVKRLTGARVVLRSGGDVDDWLGDTLAAAGGEAKTVNLIDRVRTRGDDPHWWQDPRNAILAVRAIRDALTEADPDGRARYARNADAYVARLRRLDRAISACVSRLPRDERKLVTTHDALGYFAARYGIDVVGALIPSLSTQAAPSARDTERLVGQIRRERVKAIFPESGLNPKLERAVSREAGASVGGRLWADALGPAGSSGATYLRAMESNTATIADGLSGGAVRCRPAA